MTLYAGQVLQNRYHIIAALNQGGMGAIYRAHDRRLNAEVAVKEMIYQPGIDHHTRTQLHHQFEQEATILARLQHPHLVRVTDYFQELGNAYLVMDYVGGENLADRVENMGPQDEADVVNWATQLLDALEYCHNHNVIHRDVKPHNVILRPDGRVVLVDFGLVKLYDPSSPGTATVVRGMGTPQYTPPEQYDVVGSGHTDARSDIYALGATLYHLATGKAPDTATVRMVNPGQFKPPRQVNGNISPHLESVILKAMEIPKSARYQSAAEMRSGLISGPAGDGISSSVGVWALGALVVLALIVGTTLGARTVAKSRQAQTAVAIGHTVTPRPTRTAPAATPAPVRQNSPTPEATSTPVPANTPTRGPTNTPTRRPTNTPTRRPTSTPTPRPTHTPSPTATMTPLPTPTPVSCSRAVGARFGGIWDAIQKRPEGQLKLGCPLNDAHPEYGAGQSFEHGYMLWRENQDQVYVFYENGSAAIERDQFVEGQDPEKVGYEAPRGLQEPRRGFGKIWREHLGGPNAAIGWAKEREYVAPNLTVQDFEQGMIFWEDRIGNRVLYFAGRWEKW